MHGDSGFKALCCALEIVDRTVNTAGIEKGNDQKISLQQYKSVYKEDKQVGWVSFKESQSRYINASLNRISKW
jgi:hypothetical protein